LRAAILLIVNFRLIQHIFVSAALRLVIFSLRTLVCHIFFTHLHSVLSRNAHHRLLLVIVLWIKIKFLTILVWVHHVLRLDYHSAMKTVHLIVGRCILDHLKFLIILIVDILVHLFNLHSVNLSLFLTLLVFLFCFFRLVALVFGVNLLFFLVQIFLTAVFSHIDLLGHVDIGIS